MKLVKQDGYPHACQQACIAILAGCDLRRVLDIPGVGDGRIGEAERLRACAQLGIELSETSTIVDGFDWGEERTLACLMRKSGTLLASVYDAINPNYAHAVVIHGSQLYDPTSGINPSWPWSRFFGKVRPVFKFKGSDCPDCGGTGTIKGDTSAPATSIVRHDVPCPECQEI